MITRVNRFHGYNSLRHVYRHGKTTRNQQLAIKYVLNDRRTHYRLAVVVSRKVSKSAVVRNRIRRRLYEIIRGHQDRITGPFDIVITVFNEAIATMPAPELANTLVSTLEQARILSTSHKRES